MKQFNQTMKIVQCVVGILAILVGGLWVINLIKYGDFSFCILLIPFGVWLIWMSNMWDADTAADEEQWAREIIVKMRFRGEWIDLDLEKDIDRIGLDGGFGIDELIAIAWWMENKSCDECTPADADVLLVLHGKCLRDKCSYGIECEHHLDKKYPEQAIPSAPPKPPGPREIKESPPKIKGL